MISQYVVPNLGQLSLTLFIGRNDIFCLACFTGLRFSDLNKIKTENIADGILTLRTEKTKDILTIPLNDYSIEIIDRHTSNDKIHLPHVITNQKMNEYLKELGEEAKFDDLVEQHRYTAYYIMIS